MFLFYVCTFFIVFQVFGVDFPSIPCEKVPCSFDFIYVSQSLDQLNRGVEVKGSFSKSYNLTCLKQKTSWEGTESFITRKKGEKYTWSLTKSDIELVSELNDLVSFELESFLGLISLKKSEFEYVGPSKCFDFGDKGDCDLWVVDFMNFKYEVFSKVGISSNYLFQFSAFNRTMFFQFENVGDENAEVCAYRKDVKTFKIDVDHMERPKWWVNAMDYAKVEGFDGGNSIYFPNVDKHVMVFGDTMLNRDKCSREVYGPGLSNSMLIIDRDDRNIEAQYQPLRDNKCCEMFLPVTPKEWETMRFWPGGGYSFGDTNYVFYGANMLNMEKDFNYLAKSMSKSLNFNNSNRTPYPVSSQPNEGKDGYLYFTEIIDVTFHGMFLIRVKNEEKSFVDPSKYEYWTGKIDKEGVPMFFPNKKNVEISPLLFVLNPQNSLFYNKEIGKVVMITSDSSTHFLRISDDMFSGWSQTDGIPIYFPKIPNCFTYCTFYHDFLGEKNPVYSYSLNSYDGSCKEYESQLAEIIFSEKL